MVSLSAIGRVTNPTVCIRMLFAQSIPLSPVRHIRQVLRHSRLCILLMLIVWGLPVASQAQTVPEAEPEAAPETAPAAAGEDTAEGRLRTNAGFSYEVLDPTTNFNRKQLLVLQQKKEGILASDRIYVQGAITAIANFQRSNKNDKIGYLMRQPAANNVVGDKVSEAAIHTVQLGFTGTVGNWISGHAVALFDPEQSFGVGTNTDLERNQIQMRRAAILFGDLSQMPIYASLGKMAVPFGLTDTVNPFSASTVWHVFGGLANGLKVGYVRDGLGISLMAIQGGAQFRVANTTVEGTKVPSKLNNFAIDVSYGGRLGTGASLLLGGSYMRGTAYCQDFPVAHFKDCEANNPAFDVYGRLDLGGFMFKGEFARTLDVWPGTFNPSLPEFTASKVTSFDVGVRYRIDSAQGPLHLSTEYSRFDVGAAGAPWERQDQLVVGASWHALRSAKLFAEYIHVTGFVPLNFISGGNIRDESGEIIPDRTQSDRDARTRVLMVGANVAF